MSQENVEIVRPIYEALNGRNWDTVFRDMHPDFQMTNERGPDAGTHRRREAVQRLIEDRIAAFDNLVVEPEEFLENGDQVVALVTRRGRTQGGGVDIVVRNGHLWTVRDGRILSMKSFPDQAEAVQAAGLSE